jgi:hypothetical protein
MARSRDISKVLSSNTTLATDAEVAATYQTKATTGLTLINTTNFTTQSSVSLNNVFSATYDHYKIVCSNTGSGGIVALNFKMRVNGTDSTALYYGGANGANSESNYTVFNQFNGVSAMRFGVAKSGETGTVEMIMSNPFSSSARTQFANSYIFTDGTNGRAYYSGGAMVVSTSFDGFTLIPESGTITGTISVYGYNE